MRSLEVDLEASIDLAKAAASDSLSDTANYAELARVNLEILVKSAYASLGEAASSAAEAILLTERKISEVRLTLRNPRIVLDQPIDQIAVSVVRSRR